MTEKIAVIGCGNIGMSIIEGLIREKKLKPSDIIATKRNISSVAGFPAGVHLTNNNSQAVRDSDLIIIAVKSYNFNDVLTQIREDLDPERHVLISVATGISTEYIKKEVGDNIPVFRAMPNITASVGGSVTCLSYSGASDARVAMVQELFDTIGTTMMVEESLMESATILGSCGVAFVLRFIRAMIQGGIQIGFDAATASLIVNQTVKGAAELLIKKHQHPEKEIDRVTTPKGCTIVGLNEMEHNGFSSSLIKGIVASFEKIER